MAVGERLRRLEDAVGPAPCPECGGTIRTGEYYEGELVRGLPPCPECDSASPGVSGSVRYIEVVRLTSPPPRRCLGGHPNPRPC